MWNIDWIKTLCLGSNEMSKLPSDISRITALRVLDLSNNKLRSVPASLRVILKCKVHFSHFSRICHFYIPYDFLLICLPNFLLKLLVVQIFLPLHWLITGSLHYLKKLVLLFTVNFANLKVICASWIP